MKDKAAAKPKQPHKGSAQTVATYAVPADFDKAVLPAVDLSTKKSTLLTLASALCVRFMLHRDQMPADNLPEYVKGQHLRDSDLALFEQARAEMVSAYEAAHEPQRRRARSRPRIAQTVQLQQDDIDEDDAPEENVKSSRRKRAKSPIQEQEEYEKLAARMRKRRAPTGEEDAAPAAGTWAATLHHTHAAMQHPEVASALYQQRAALMTATTPDAPSFELVGGSATRRGCWVAALSWAACGQAPFLGSLPPLKPYDAHAPGSSATRALLPLACIAPPDMRGVTCLHMRCITTPQEFQRLQICAGKQAGTLMSWQSQPFLTHGELPEAAVAGTLAIRGQAQGTLPISSVAWSSGTQSASSRALSTSFLASSLNGSLHHWTVSGKEMLLSEDLGKRLVTGNGHTLCVPLFGVAASVCGSQMAVVRSSLSQALGNTKRKQAHASLLHGVLHLAPCFCPTVQAALALLEAQQDVADTSSPQALPGAGGHKRLQALRCATALRHILHPQRPVPAYLVSKLPLGQKAAPQHRATAPDALLDWQTALASSESLLLQAHISACLRAAASTPDAATGEHV
ncbi:hypothetical protein WJX84_009635 [Apatococcus fuscideae]|uniref:Uncharacterized protein n=1 Tax=Apatococcus fuscideae TaxID=2026836 RepID=A0AAW1RJF7_9CHLO